MNYTGEYFLNNAMALLGYSLNERIGAKAVSLINLVYSDLWHICGEGEFEPLKSLKQRVNLPKRALDDVFVLGLAMFLAQSEEDTEQQSFYSYTYAQKRASLSKIDKITDVSPLGGVL